MIAKAIWSITSTLITPAGSWIFGCLPHSTVPISILGSVISQVPSFSVLSTKVYLKVLPKSSERRMRTLLLGSKKLGSTCQ